MVDGVALLTTLIHALRAGGQWGDEPGTNFLDSGAHFYEVYETSDGGHVAVGAIEPQFYAELLALLGIDPRRGAAVGPRALAGAQGALRDGLPLAHARRVGRAARAGGGVRDRGAGPARGPRAPAQSSRAGRS